VARSPAEERLLTPAFLVLITTGVFYFLAFGMVIPVLPRYVEGPLGGGSVAVGFVVIYTLLDNLRRTDHSGPAKAGWTLVIFVLPLAGALAYIVTRPEMTSPPLRPAF